jgi:hypothetical protein
MSEEEAIAFFCAEISAHTRTLPLAEATAFLRGAMCLIGPHDGVTALREAYMRLFAADHQLELLASPQLRLPLKPAAANGQESQP